MTISTIIPIYNAEKTIFRAVDSILKQTLLSHEIICCLNQCTDGTKKILQNIARQNGSIQIIEQNLYKGIVPTLNKCIEELSDSCTLIARMDADDFSYHNRFEKQIDFLDKNQDVDILSAQMRVVDKSNFIPTGTITHNPLIDSQIKKNLEDSINPISHPLSIFKRNILLKLGGYNDYGNLKYCEDFDLWLRAKRAGFKFANLNEILLDYTESKNVDYTPIAPQILSWNHNQINKVFPV